MSARVGGACSTCGKPRVQCGCCGPDCLGSWCECRDPAAAFEATVCPTCFGEGCRADCASKACEGGSCPGCCPTCGGDGWNPALRGLASSTGELTSCDPDHEVTALLDGLLRLSDVAAPRVTPDPACASAFRDVAIRVSMTEDDENWRLP